MRWKKSVTVANTHGSDEVGDLNEHTLDGEVVLALVGTRTP